MPAERRRELWLEPLPASELAGRLRPLPLFAAVSVDELFRIASTSRQVRHEPGSMLLQEGSIPVTLHLLDGDRARGRAAHSVESPAALSFVEALQGRPMTEALRASGRAVTFDDTASCGRCSRTTQSSCAGCSRHSRIAWNAG